MVYEISAAVATIAFVLLVIFIIITLNKVILILKNVNGKIEEVNTKQLSSAIAQLTETTNEITGTVKTFIRAFNPLFESVSKMGNIVNGFTEDFQKKLDETEPHHEGKSSRHEGLIAVVQLVALSILLLKQLRK